MRVQIRDRDRDRKFRLKVEMQDAMTERRQINECRAVVDRLQGKRQIDSDSGGAAAALRVYDREYFSPGTFTPRFTASRRQPDKGFEQVGRIGRAFDVFPHP